MPAWQIQSFGIYVTIKERLSLIQSNTFRGRASRVLMTFERGFQPEQYSRGV